MGKVWTSSRFSKVDPGTFRPDRSARGGPSIPGAGGSTTWAKGPRGMKFGIGLKGFKKFKKTHKRVKQTAKMSLATAMYQEGERIIGNAKKPVNVPVKTGLLRSTGHVKLPVLKNRKIIVECGFGGPAKAYAKIQHEGRFNHPRGGRRHYLLIPAQQAAKNMNKRVGRKIGRAIKIAVGMSS